MGQAQGQLETHKGGRARQLSPVTRQPVHDHIESIMKSEVVDDDGPDGRLSQHAQPGGRWGLALAAMLGRTSMPAADPRYMPEVLRDTAFALSCGDPGVSIEAVDHKPNETMSMRRPPQRCAAQPPGTCTASTVGSCLHQGH
ncbi:MAG: hypothetical protein FRX49_13054 [Trebouxia sp. A1-2]|nr:MAG: hypothetical protein FRX49_13054 [Trebouxia sp. A1-2]